MGGSLFGRSEVEGLMGVEFTRCQRYDLPLTCFLVELEGLDQLGTIHGHGSCEEMRARVAELLERSSRSGDLLGYPEGNLLWMLLPHTGRLAAEGMARRVRSEVSQWDFSNGEVSVRVCVRVGIASNEESGMECLQDLQSAAFYALQDDGGAGSPFSLRQHPAQAVARERDAGGAGSLPESRRDPSRSIMGQDSQHALASTAGDETCVTGQRGAVLLSIFQANLALREYSRRRKAI